MSNHFHLLIRSAEGRLAEGMQYLAGRFTRLINVRVARDGPLFRGRYASVGIESDAHMVQALRYIHLNPVAAGMTPTPEAWRWSSAAAYLGSVGTPAWLTTNYVLDLFGPSDARASYRHFMAAGADATTNDFYDKLGW